MSVAEANDVRRSLQEERQRRAFVLDDWWRPSWFPFLARANGDLMVVDLTGTFDAPGSIVEWRHDDSRRLVRASGLDGWLEALVASLEEGVWRAEPAAEGGDPALAEWWELPEFAATAMLEGEFDRLVKGYPKRVDIAAERDPQPPKPPTTPEEWAAAVCEGLTRSARDATSGALPSGFAARRLEAGVDLPSLRRMLERASPEVRAAELAAIAARLRAKGDLRYLEVGLEALEVDDPFILMAVLHEVGADDDAVRARLLAHVEPMLSRRPVGTAAFFVRLAAALRARDPRAAEQLDVQALALRPRGASRFFVDLATAGRSGGVEGAKLLHLLFESGDFLRAAWSNPVLFDAAWNAALAAGMAREFAETRARVAVAPGVSRALVDRLASVGLQELAAAVAVDPRPLVPPPVGAAPWSRAHLARIELEYAEGLITPEERVDLRVAAIDAALRARDMGWAIELLDVMASETQAEVRQVVERSRSALNAGSSYEAVAPLSTPADLEARAMSWNGDPNSRPTRSLLLAIAQSAGRSDAPFGRAQLDRVRAAIAKQGDFGRFEGALAWALAKHGLWDEALATARATWPHQEGLFAQLIELLAASGRKADALSLGHHLTEVTLRRPSSRDELTHWATLAPAVGVLTGLSDAIRSALDRAYDSACGRP